MVQTVRRRAGLAWFAFLLVSIGHVTTWGAEGHRGARGDTPASRTDRDWWMAPAREALAGTAGTVSHAVAIPPAGAQGEAKLWVAMDDANSDERGGPTVTRVSCEAGVFLVPDARKEWRWFSMPADPTAIQTLQIDGRMVFVHVFPGEEIRFQPNSCFGWSLASRRYETETPGTVYVRIWSDTRGQLDLGYNQDGSFHRTRRVRLLPGKTGPYYAIETSHCRMPAIRLEGEVLLAMGNGARWTVTVRAQKTLTATNDQ